MPTNPFEPPKEVNGRKVRWVPNDRAIAVTLVVLGALLAIAVLAWLPAVQ